MPQFIYTMKGLGKVYPPDTKVLDDIWLSFLPGRRSASSGRTAPARAPCSRSWPASTRTSSARRGRPTASGSDFLPQEPQLDATKNVLGNVEEGVEDTRGLLRRFEEISAKFGEDLSTTRWTALLEQQGKLQDQIDAVGAWELDRTRDRHGCPAPAAGRCRGRDALRRREAPRGALPAAAAEARPAAARRAHQPPGRRDGRLARAHLQDYPGTVVAVTHDRYFLDNVAGLDPRARPRPRHSVGRATTRRGSSRSSSGWRSRRRRRQAPAHPRARARMGAHVAARATGQEQGASAGLREAGGEERPSRCRRPWRSPFRPARGSATW